MIADFSIQQGSPEWFSARAGNPGASSFDRIVTTKGEPSKQRKEYLYELAGELIAGPQTDGYCSHAMQRGTLLEPEARDLFALIHGPVKEVGICFRDENKKYHCSPDGLTEDGTGLELKNPMLKTHVKYLLQDKCPTEYFSQVQGSMLVCDTDEWFFMSNFPAMPPLIIKCHRDGKFIAKLESALDEFCEELKEVHDQLLARV